MITQAKKQNSLNLPILIHNAIHDIANTLTGENEKDKILETLDLYISMDVNRLSYNNIWTYELENEIAGLILAYDSNKVKELDGAILEYLKTKNIFLDAFEKECFADEFYIDTVSVFEEFQGRGIAKELFSFVEAKARGLEYKKLSLLVDFENQKALKLYEKIGFKKNHVLKVSNHDYHHMIKMI
jgi:ribosomal protein S18 acetylase RimI-like enzyme